MDQAEKDEATEPQTAQCALPWRQPLAVLAITLLIILVIYRETALSMAAIWARSDTFAHGFLVPLITLWLVWRKRASFADVVPRPNYWVLLLIAGAGFGWLLGEMATVGPLSQFALTAMVILAVPAVLGLDAARKIIFPLAFLFFAVPFGEFAMPQLMEWTADVTILGLRASGIPVYREGLHFIIPSGAWSVVEACSGVRYLIASLMVGTLFAYLNYRSLKRRLLFVGLAFLVPIVANWARAYLIVMLGHLSGNKLAAGVDHLIYGWLFFGVVILAMFWIGARWREDDVEMSPETTIGVASLHWNNTKLLPAALATVLVAALWPFAEWQIERNAPADISRIEAIPAVQGWTRTTRRLSDWEPVYGNASAYLHDSYSADAGQVGLYLAYYRNQGPERKLVTSVNDLVSSETRRWIRVSEGLRDEQLGDKVLALRTAELRSVDASRLIVWRWYWINGRLTRSDHLAKAYTALYKLFGQGDDSAVVIAYAPRDTKETLQYSSPRRRPGSSSLDFLDSGLRRNDESNGGAEALLSGFVSAALPSIEAALRQTRSQR
jgi:exosortase A